LTDSLHQAVNLLLRRPTRRIDVGPAHYTVRAPCLLQQLADAVAASTNGAGGRTTPGSKLPVNTDAMDLLHEIEFSVHTWARDLDIDRRPYLKAAEKAAEPAPGYSHAERLIRQRAAARVGRAVPVRDEPPPTGLLLRAVAAAVSGRTDREDMAQAIERNCRRWDTRIRTLIDPDERLGRDLTRVACPHCGVAWVVPDYESEIWRPSTTDPTLVRVPALWAEVGTTGVIRCLWCRACSTYTWRDDLASMAPPDDETPGEAA
jgi:hypothetical protein